MTRRPTLLAVAVVVLVGLAACGGSAKAPVQAAGRDTTAVAGQAVGSDVSTGATTASTTVPLSRVCTERGNTILRPGARDGLTVVSGGLTRTDREFVPSTNDPVRPAP